MSLPSYMRPEQPKGDTPTFNMGEQIKASIKSIEKTTGEYGPQYQIDVTFPSKNNWSGRAWIKIYAVPAPNQHLGKLCLAIERVTGQKFQSVEGAVNALKSYGRIFFRVKGYTPSKTKVNADGTPVMYPKYSVMPDTLPGEQVQPPIQSAEIYVPPQPTAHTKEGIEALINVEMAKAAGLLTRDACIYIIAQNLGKDVKQIQELLMEKRPNGLQQLDLSTESYNWLAAHQHIIGQQIPSTAYNKIARTPIPKELYSKGLIVMKEDYPWLTVEARKYL